MKTSRLAVVVEIPEETEIEVAIRSRHVPSEQDVDFDENYWAKYVLLPSDER